MPSAEEIRYGLNLAGLDGAALGDPLWRLASAIASRPSDLLRSSGELALDQLSVLRDIARTALGVHEGPAVAPEPGDRRFEDRAWRENPFLSGLLQSYLVAAAWWRRQVEASNLPEPARRQARYALGIVLDALAPTNLPWTNPAVLKEALDTGGLSLARGLAHMFQDLVRNNGLPSQVDRSSFELGVDLAATPGRVVYRNELIELLMYAPKTATVFEQPLLVSPPWINKYYILDLAPGRSLIEFAVHRGFTVFAISYRNPDRSMASMTMDDYLELGVLAALKRVSAITTSSTVNLLGLCVGGTMGSIALAYLASRRGRPRVGWLTLLNTLLDFGQPGEVSVFTDESGLRRTEAEMKRKGYFEGSAMTGTFNWMRGRELVWDFVISNWYLGKQPPASDIMAWSVDATNLPAAMHAQYLRACYLRNLLVRPGAFEIAGAPVDLSRVKVPIYVLGSESDHITPWRSTYRTTQLVSGHVRYVLSSRGHIAGVVNPPSNSKAGYWTSDLCPPDPDEWRLRASEHLGSWWEDWAGWASARSGLETAPPAMPAGEPAPGRYVLNQTGPPTERWPLSTRALRQRLASAS